jgi:hypothetical protein
VTGDDERAKDDVALASTLASDDIPRTNPIETDVRGADPALAATMTPEVLSTHTRGKTTLTTEHPGRYVRKEEIGRGGMGRVLVVNDAHLGRDVALKELLDQTVPGNDAVSVGSAARFLREARITGQLEHPGIVPVHELGQRADGTIYYTMKRIRGRSLASILKEKATLAERLTLLSAFRHVCEAVAYAHSQGVVHRDLKPDNVMIGEFGDTLVVDWGLAKVHGEADIASSNRPRTAADDAARTLDGHAIGTPAYMSPEQARGELGSIDERADVWGLGAILFEIVVGRPPYVGTSALDVLAKVLEDPPPHVRDVAPDAPAELAAVADRAMMRDPSSRYPNAGEVAKEIGAYLDGRTVGAYEYSSYELALRFVRRHRAASFATISIALSVIVASVLVYRSFLDEQHARGLAELARDDAMEQRAHAEDSMHAAERAVVDALLERAERSLADGDASAAAVFAAGALAQSAEEHHARALGLYFDADARRRYAFEQIVQGGHWRSALSTDGRALAIPTESAIRLVSLDDRSERRIELHVTRVRALGADGLAVVEADAPGVYDLSTATLRSATPAPTGAAIGDDAIVVGAATGEVVVLDGEGRAIVDRWTSPFPGTLRVAMGGGHLALLSTDLARVEIDTVPRGPHPITVTLDALPYLAAFSPNGARLAVLASDFIASIPIGATTTTVRQLGTRSWPTALAWAGDAAVAIYENGDRITLRDIVDGHVIDVVHVPGTSSGRLDAGGDRLVFLPNPSGSGVLDVATVFHASAAGRDAVTLDAGVRDVQIDSPRRRVVAATLGAVWAIPVGPSGRLGTATQLFALPEGVGIVARMRVAPDGTIAVVTLHGGMVVAEPPELQPVTVRAPRSEAGAGGLTGLTIATSGDVFYGSPTDDGVTRWTRREHAETELVRGSGTSGIAAIAVSPDGTRLALGLRDGSVRIVSASSGAMERTVSAAEDRVTAIAFAPAGDRLAVADQTGHVRILDAHDGHRLCVAQPQPRYVNGLSWSGDGRWVVETSDERRVDVLSATDLVPARIVRTASAPISAFFAADSSHLVYHDGRSVLQLDLRMTIDEPSPTVLLEQAEQRAGVHLDGLTLGPRSP